VKNGNGLRLTVFVPPAPTLPEKLFSRHTHTVNIIQYADYIYGIIFAFRLHFLPFPL